MPFLSLAVYRSLLETGARFCIYRI